MEWGFCEEELTPEARNSCGSVGAGQSTEAGERQGPELPLSSERQHCCGREWSVQATCDVVTARFCRELHPASLRVARTPMFEGHLGALHPPLDGWDGPL